MLLSPMKSDMRWVMLPRWEITRLIRLHLLLLLPGIFLGFGPAQHLILFRQPRESYPWVEINSSSMDQVMSQYRLETRLGREAMAIRQVTGRMMFKHRP